MCGQKDGKKGGDPDSRHDSQRSSRPHTCELATRPARGIKSPRPRLPSKYCRSMANTAASTSAWCSAGQAEVSPRVRMKSSASVNASLRIPLQRLRMVPTTPRCLAQYIGNVQIRQRGERIIATKLPVLSTMWNTLEPIHDHFRRMVPSGFPSASSTCKTLSQK